MKTSEVLGERESTPTSLTTHKLVSLGLVGMSIATSGVPTLEGKGSGLRVQEDQKGRGVVLVNDSTMETKEAKRPQRRRRLTFRQAHCQGQTPPTDDNEDEDPYYYHTDNLKLTHRQYKHSGSDDRTMDGVPRAGGVISEASTSDFYELTDGGTTSDSSFSMCPFSDDGSDTMSLEEGGLNSPIISQKQALFLDRRHRRCSSVSSDSLLFCQEHPSLGKTLYCLECDLPLCLKCKVSPEHADHKSTTFINAAVERRRQLNSLEKNLKCKTLNLSLRLSEYEEYAQSLVVNKRTVMEKLESRAKYLHQLVDRWQGKMSLQVDAVCSHEMAKVNARIEDITYQLAEFREEMDYLSQVLCHNQASDLLAVSHHLLTERDAEDEDEQLLEGPLERLYFLLNPGSGVNYTDFGEFTASHRKTSSPGMQVISSGKLSFSFDTRCGEKSHFSATGLSINPDGNLLVTDLGMDRVQLFKPSGQRLLCLDTLPGDEPSKAVTLNNSTIAVASRYDVKFYNQSGKFGKKLNQHVDCPNSLHVSPSSGELLITDLAHDGPFIHILNPDLTLKNTIIGGNRAPSFLRPWYVTSDATGHVIITDYAEHNVKVFSPRGILISEFGGPGAQPGRFFRPAGVCIDQFGHILVADSGNNRVQMFTRQGHLCAVLLTEDVHELSCPMDLEVNEQGQLVVLQESGVVATYSYMY